MYQSQFSATQRGLLSALWISVLIQTVFRDIHQLVKPGFLDEIADGVFQGTVVTDWHFLFGAVILQLPIWMIVLSHALSDRSLVVTHRIAVPLMSVMPFLAWPSDPDDWFHTLMQFIALGAMLYVARPNARPVDENVDKCHLAVTESP
ncbi:MAG: DUF6326 family protein [Pseudomonadota bacterium]